MEENPVHNVTTVEDRTRRAHPHPPWRWIFVVLLIATLLSALGTTYILITGQKPTLVRKQLNTEADNPFASQPETTNPFVSSQITSNNSNPFAENNSNNPFSQFDTDSSNSNSAGASGAYQNPF